MGPLSIVYLGLFLLESSSRLRFDINLSKDGSTRVVEDLIEFIELM